MLPATSTRWPSRSTRWPATAEVVLLPFVPVTHSTRSRGASSSHMARPPTTATPSRSSAATSGRSRLMPGVLTTTSQAASASSPPSPMARTGRPPRPPAGGWSSTSVGSTPRDSRRRMAAWPSTPSPHTPTRRPGRSAQRSAGGVGIRDEVLTDRDEQRGDVVGTRQAVAELVGQRPQDRGAGPVRPLDGEGDGGPALADLADALPGLQRPGRVDQALEAGEQVEVVERLAPVEDGGQVVAGHERREDEVDERALVAPAAPAVEPLRRVDVEAPVAALEGPVVGAEVREPLGDEQLGVGPQAGEVVDARPDRAG